MKHNLIVAALFSVALAAPALAQDKPLAETPKADASQVNKPSKKHSHLEERHGIKPSTESARKKDPVDKKLHSHPKEKN